MIRLDRELHHVLELAVAVLLDVDTCDELEPIQLMKASNAAGGGGVYSSGFVGSLGCNCGFYLRTAPQRARQTGLGSVRGP